MPPGIYDCTLDEIYERFGRFNGTEQRPNLYKKLVEFVKATKSSNLGAKLIVNGSFTSNKPDPGDIDLVVELPANHDLAADLTPDAYNSISRKRVAKRYGFDILVAAEGSVNHANYLDLYQSLKNREDRKKGVLRLQP